MTAEGVANAILHGSGLISVTIETDGRRLRVEVSDDGPAATDPNEPPRLDHGRGLTVIDALADEWALDQSPRRTRLWFVVDARRPAAAV
jgi:anti-sigma regulatory factor (Ser/Thr protein kinase)